MIETRAVSKSFRSGIEDVKAVAGVSLSCKPGEFLCIYGASGSGKSTLLNLICGLDSPDAGEIWIQGTSIQELNESRRAAIRLEKIGVVFQDHNLLPELSALENVNLPLLARRIPFAAARASSIQALSLVGIANLADRQPGAMSGGQRQRVGIARALAGERRILVADEPTGSLDSKNSEQLFGLLRDLAQEQECTIVVATHDPVGKEFATSVATMVDGKLSPS